MKQRWAYRLGSYDSWKKAMRSAAIYRDIYRNRGSDRVPFVTKRVIYGVPQWCIYDTHNVREQRPLSPTNKEGSS